MIRNAEQYLHEVDSRLSPLSTEIRLEVLRELRSHIEVAASAGEDERSVLRKLGAPVKLTDALLEAHGVFRAFYKRQEVALGIYVFIVATCVILWARLFADNMTRIALSAELVYGSAVALWILGCLPYYFFVVRSRKLLWKPLLVATLCIWSTLSLSVEGLINLRTAQMLSPYSIKFWQSEHLSKVESGEKAVRKILATINENPARFGRAYRNSIKDLDQLCTILELGAPQRAFLVPVSDPLRDSAMRFSTESSVQQAQYAWITNRDRLEKFAKESSDMVQGYRSGFYPRKWYSAWFTPMSATWTLAICAPLCMIAWSLSRFRPMVPRRRSTS